MKTIRYMVLACAVSILPSCDKWLDITPEDTTTEKQLFSDAGGYHSAVNGLYQAMSDPQLYGENLTWGFVSALSQYYDSYDQGNTLKFSYTEQYDYASDEVKAFGEEIWSTAYNVIANANNIIQHIQKADPSVFPAYEAGEMDLIKGEALAVRALMHFEILRLFAKAPAVAMEEMAIPYSTSYPDKFPERKTTKVVLENIIKDLTEAAGLLKPIDMKGDGGYLNRTYVRYIADNSGNGYFFSGRGVRLNYISVTSLLARVHAYSGNIDDAYTFAKEIIDNYYKDPDDAIPWYGYTKFSTGTSESERPHKTIEDLVISFYATTLVNDYEASGATANHGTNPYKLKNLEYIFADAKDYRQTMLVVPLGGGKERKGSLKYLTRNGGDLAEVENSVLPIMRISELHLIMTEYLVGKGENGEAVKLLNEIRLKRGCTILLSETETAEVINEEIEKEYWREYVAEGQYFFFCKRKNLQTINNNGVYIQMNGKYTMLIPDSETSLN